MSWMTVLWSMPASASLTFALLHLLVWAKGIQTRANLSFALAALAATALTGMELMSMRATSTEQMAIILRWAHLPLLVLWVAILYFVRFYFDAGRTWLAWSAAGLRVLALILSFTTGQNLFFNEITGLKHIVFFGGETISIPQGTLNPWYVVGPLSALALAAFVLDAAFTMRRGGTATGRRRAILFSGSITFFLLTSVGHGVLVNAGLINSPYIIGLSFMPILLAMSYELSCDMLHAAQLAQQLQASEAELRINKQRMDLAASAAELRLWEWDIILDEVWSTDKGHLLFGIAESQKISFVSFLNILHDEDREQVKLAVEKSMAGNGDYESEYRIKMPDGQTRWFYSRGRIEFSKDNQPQRMLGVTIDITRRIQAELAEQQQRKELTHLSRVTTLGELSGSLAHELSQPLTAILCNAQAAQNFLARDKVDLSQIQDILKDIIAEDKRAADIMHRIRLLLKKCEIEQLPVDVNKVVLDVLKLVSSDLVSRNITVQVDLDQKLPAVIGDRVQLQQALLNLIMNACEAMTHTQANNRQLFVCTELAGVGNAQVSVGDLGPGIPPENLASIFEPFFTTKLPGMGLGLSICRTIISAHGGQLWASNNTGSGAIFYFTLPIFPGESA
ncbi:MAG: ATP-binding protein [Methylobacter sp.]|uniref:PAS domain-containing sensor histidine kinase n=1 Tax=Methylobacter sp. TaxID=2051955 RepID=UPI0027304FC5|nr:PAS domain-containing sensor histidine kinase [Methylobacter sp.]MDP1667347.1 ATP-binding protein [Methylobacter sp.]